MRAFYLVYREAIHPQAVGELAPEAILRLPWGHNQELLFKLHDLDSRLWYAEQAAANGWSRSMLVHQIALGLRGRQGQAANNFSATLPPPQSDLARQVTKDPYTFDFLTLSARAKERDLEKGLLHNLQKLLLELGAGFAFVGRQVPLEVAGEDYHLDLLFYHLRLRCFVVIEYALRDLRKPIGVAGYSITRTLPPALSGRLPDEAELRARLADAD